MNSSFKNSSEYYIQGIKNKDRIILSKAITLIESTKKEDEQLADEILQACLSVSKKSKRMAVSGSPGAGKSTFINTIGKTLLNENKSLAVLAIDPSSTISKGSILGDKTRMDDLVGNEKCYIRPTASNRNLGGVARNTRETILLCEAFGFDYIFVEMYLSDLLPDFVYTQKFISKLSQSGKKVIFNHLFYDSQKKSGAEKLIGVLEKNFTHIQPVRNLTNLLLICSN